MWECVPMCVLGHVYMAIYEHTCEDVYTKICCMHVYMCGMHIVCLYVCMSIYACMCILCMRTSDSECMYMYIM